MPDNADTQWPPLAPRLDKTDPHLRLLFVSIFVRDQDKSLKFYVEQLGFRVVFDSKIQEGGRFIVVAPPDGTAVLALVAPDPDSPEYKMIGHSTGLVFITEDIAYKYKQWSEHGVRFLHPPIKPSWGGLLASLEDIDGNPIKLVSSDDFIQGLDAQRRAITEQQEAERRNIQELEIAKQVQARLFPQTLPSARTLDYAGVCIQARKVGGDYYDFLNLGRERLGLVIGDIAGKGMAGALLRVNLQANLRSQSATALDEPQRMLRSVNNLFYENTGDTAYATLFFAEYDDRARRLRYANCGHLPALLMRGDGAVEKLDSTCTVLGLFEQWDCYMGERRLHPGDTLVIYTDGVTESFNASGEEFGEDRLIDTLTQKQNMSSQELLNAVVNEVQQFSPQEQHDDVTLIVAKCRG
jgi:serine phosphatase RsbU (regulator of sigma subunit)/predicted enzyme related to lactoylglutathione lyase